MKHSSLVALTECISTFLGDIAGKWSEELHLWGNPGVGPYVRTIQAHLDFHYDSSKKLSYWKLFKAQSKDNQKVFNFRENGELPPLLTVRCHHGEIKLKEVTPVRLPIIQYYCTSSGIKFDDITIYFQPSDPPIDFDSDDEDDEDEDY